MWSTRSSLNKNEIRTYGKKSNHGFRTPAFPVFGAAAAFRNENKTGNQNTKLATPSRKPLGELSNSENSSSISKPKTISKTEDLTPKVEHVTDSFAKIQIEQTNDDTEQDTETIVIDDSADDESHIETVTINLKDLESTPTEQLDIVIEDSCDDESHIETVTINLKDLDSALKEKADIVIEDSDSDDSPDCSTIDISLDELDTSQEEIITMEDLDVDTVIKELEEMQLKTKTKSLSVFTTQELINQILSNHKILDTIASFLTMDEINQVASLNRSWAAACFRFAENRILRDIHWLCANFEMFEPQVHSHIRFRDSASIMNAFPNVCYLSSGSFKSVYKVWVPHMNRFEAISTMSLDALHECSTLHQVRQESLVSTKLSSIVRSGSCVNFIETYQIFLTNGNPFNKLKNKEHDTHNTADDTTTGVFLYIRMELCDRGDLEELIKEQPDQVFPMKATCGILFQMCFALYMGDMELKLRHYDVKLLNFFCMSVNSAGDSYKVEIDDGITYRDQDSKIIVKLADFGTSEIDNLSKVSLLDHLCTYENTSPEILLMGNLADPSYSDMFALGLCMLHLLTGGQPYEETMSHIRCPDYLRKLLTTTWQKDENFGCVQEAYENDDEKVLCDTLYRYFVLFGLPSGEAEWGTCYGPVAKALDRGFSSSSRSWVGVREKFEEHRQDCAFMPDATNKYIRRAYQRAESVPGVLEFFGKLTHFDPLKRFRSYDEMIHDPCFEILKC